LIARLLIGRRRFEHGDGPGVQQFHSYDHALWTGLGERAAMLIADLLSTAGGLLLAAAALCDL